MSKEDKIVRAVFYQILEDLENKIETEPHNIEATQSETTWQLLDHGVEEKDDLKEDTDGNWVYQGRKISISLHAIGKRDRGNFARFINVNVTNHSDISDITIQLKWYHRFTPLVIRTKRMLKKGWAVQRLNEALTLDKKFAKLNSDRIDKILLGDKKGEKEQSDKQDS